MYKQRRRHADFVKQIGVLILIKTIFAAIAMLGMVGTASAGTYVFGAVGQDRTTGDSSAVVISGGVGVELQGGWRIEGELLNTRGDVEVTALTLGAAYDIDTGTAWTPYLTVNAGWASFDGAKNADGLIYGGGVGVQYAVTENVALDVGYRYSTTDVDVIDNRWKAVDYERHDVRIGVKIAL